MRLRLVTLWATLHGSYWFIPSLMTVGAFVLAFTLLRLDQTIPARIEQKIGWIYSGGPTGARAVLSTIAGSVITVAGTTFSITIAALSLASSQFGPRLLRSFRRDTGNQIVLGTFIATFLYCLLVLKTVRGTDQTTYVPGVSITMGLLLAVLSMVVLIYFIHHMAGSIQVSHVIHSVSADLNCAIAENFPKTTEPCEDEHAEKRSTPSNPVTRGEIVSAPKNGYLLHVDSRALRKLAEQENCMITLHCAPGDYLIADMPLLEFSAGISADERLSTAVLHYFYFGMERTPEQDTEYAFIQVAQIGVRALSPGINDPFTAIACIDRLAAGMTMITQRRIPSRFHYDSSGRLRLVAKEITYRQMSDAAFLYIRRAAGNNREVLGYLLGRISLVLSQTENQALKQALEEHYDNVNADLKRSAL